MGTVISKFFIGAFAGLAVWAIAEPMAPHNLADSRWASWELTLLLLFGVVVGGAIGGLDGFTRGGKVHFLRGLGMGALFGAIGSSLGSSIGGGLSRSVFGAAVFAQGALPVQMMARMLVFIPLGFLLGAAIGGSSLTPKKTIQGAIGGALGGALGGMMFDVIGAALAPFILNMRGIQPGTVGEVGGPSRAIALTLMAAAIGLFIGLVERATRSAWLRLSLGKNEGKEWSIDGGQTFIGRSESAQVPLFGDPNVAPVHASIVKHGNQYILQDGGSPVGTFVNGQRVQQVALTHGSVIQIAGFPLQFLMKGIPAPVPMVDMRAVAQMQAGAPAGYMPQPQPQMQPQMAPQMAPQMPTGAMTQAYPSSPAVSNQTVAYGASPVAAGFLLVAMDGPMMGQRFPINGLVEVGREGSGIRLNGDANASRRHATVSPSMGGVQVTDLGSTNGTFVNGNRVPGAEARMGDVIKIGSTTFRVEPA